MPEIPFLAARTVGQVRDLGGDDLLRRLVGLLLELTPPRLGAVREGLGAGDLKAVRTAAHTLSSTAGIVGATALLGAAQRVEGASSLDEALAAAEVLEIEWLRLREPLGNWLAAPEAPE